VFKNDRRPIRLYNFADGVAKRIEIALELSIHAFSFALLLSQLSSIRL
jgi:hypothetical protein